MKKKISILFIGALLALGCGLTACGGGSNEPPAPSKVTLTINSGEHFTIEPREGFLKDGTSEIKKGTQITFDVQPQNGYKDCYWDLQFSANGGPAQDRSADKAFHYTVNEDTVITILNFKHDDVYHDITFTTGDGFTYTNVSVQLENDKASVLEGTDVTFKVSVDDNYDDSEMVVKAGATPLTPVTDIYTVNVNADIVITVTGLKEKAQVFGVTFVPGLGSTITGANYPITNNVAHVEENEEIYFQLVPDEGYTVDSVEVTANQVIVPFNSEDEHYHVTITEETTITISNASLLTYDVYMIDGVNYQFTDVTGVILDDGVGEVSHGDTISFKISISEGYEKTADFAVKAGTTTLTADEDGVYETTITDDTAVTVTGVEHKIINIMDNFVMETFAEDTQLPEGGVYEHSFAYTGRWAKLSLANIELKDYSELSFAVKCDGTHYFEIFKTDGNPADYEQIATTSSSWTTYRFVKEDITEEGAQTRTYNYRCYMNGNWTQLAIGQNGSLSDISIRLGETGVFVITNLAGRHDQSYVPPVEEVVSDIVIAGTTFDPSTSTSTVSASWGSNKAFVKVENIETYKSIYFNVSFAFPGGGTRGYMDINPSSYKGGGSYTMYTGNTYTVRFTIIEGGFKVTFDGGQTDFVTKEIMMDELDLSAMVLSIQDGSGSTCTATFGQLIGVK